jgi:drug/metabolite transporter (DMT)-like permease
VSTAVLGYLIFDEVLTPTQLLGMALTVTGVAIINRGRGTRAGTDPD